MNWAAWDALPIAAVSVISKQMASGGILKIQLCSRIKSTNSRLRSDVAEILMGPKSPAIRAYANSRQSKPAT